MSINSPIRAEDRWFQGEDRDLEFTVVDAAGAAVNCVTFQLLWKLYDSQSSGVVRLSKASGGGGITTFGVASTSDGIRVAIADTDTITGAGAETIAAAIYWYELWRTDEGSERLLASGDAVLQASRRRQEIA